LKIVDIRETVVPMKSDFRNAYIAFSQMTVSAVVLITKSELYRVIRELAA